MKVEVAMIYVRHPYRIKGNDLIKVFIEIPRPIYIRNKLSNMLPEGICINIRRKMSKHH
jgi:hypothetical protein